LFVFPKKEEDAVPIGTIEMVMTILVIPNATVVLTVVTLCWIIFEEQVTHADACLMALLVEGARVFG
jgi:hypothetical protein